MRDLLHIPPTFACKILHYVKHGVHYNERSNIPFQYFSVRDKSILHAYASVLAAYKENTSGLTILINVHFITNSSVHIVIYVHFHNFQIS